MKRCAVTIVMFLAGMTLGTTAAHADVTRTVSSTPISESYLDPGCHETDLIHIEGQETGHVTVVNGDFHVALVAKGSLTFTEDGENFVGRFTRTFSILLKAGETFAATTQEFTSTAAGDQRRHAVLHVVVHSTYFAAADKLTANARSLHQSCT